MIETLTLFTESILGALIVAVGCSIVGVFLVLRRIVFVGAALAVGASVSVSGVIGFVGLVVPHVLRPFLGYRPGPLVLASGIGGALLVLAADMLIRGIDSATEMKIGVLTAIVGAPFFIHLIYSTRSLMR